MAKTADKQLAYIKEWQAANPERVRAYKAKNYAKSQSEIEADPEYQARKALRNAKRNEWRRKQRAGWSYSRRRDDHLRTTYGITLGDYQDMWDAQDGLCAICRKPERQKNTVGVVRLLSVDHKRGTKFVRALLCGGCNMGIGHFLEDPDSLRAAADYLESFLA